MWKIMSKGLSNLFNLLTKTQDSQILKKLKPGPEVRTGPHWSLGGWYWYKAGIASGLIPA